MCFPETKVLADDEGGDDLNTGNVSLKATALDLKAKNRQKGFTLHSNLKEICWRVVTETQT
jgi:hypothetical protein